MKRIALCALIVLAAFVPCIPASAHTRVHYGLWRVSIPAIGVNADIIGINRPSGHFRYLPVPPLSQAGYVGWYRFSARPGDRGDTVLVGHVDTYVGPAVFYNLYRLRPGNSIYLTTAPGHTVRYAVRWVKEVPKQRFPAAAVFGHTNARRLWLITCGGSFNYVTRHYMDNIIVSAG